MTKCLLSGALIAIGVFAGPMANISDAGRFWSIDDPTANESFTTTANIATTGHVTSNDEELPANNLAITVKIRNVAQNVVMQSFAATTSGMDYHYGVWADDLDAPSGGWIAGNADIEVWYDDAKQASVRVNIVSPP